MIGKRRNAQLVGVGVVLLSVVLSSGVFASELAAPVDLDISVAGTPSLSSTVSVTLTAVPQVDCELVELSIDTLFGVSVVGGSTRWRGTGKRGVPYQFTVTMQITKSGILPIGGTVIARATGSSLTLARSECVYLDVPAQGKRAVGRVLRQAPVPVGPYRVSVGNSLLIKRISGSRQQQNAVLRGKFQYYQNGDSSNNANLRPVANCRVVLYEGVNRISETSTGADGSFSFTVTRGKTYTVELRSETTDGTMVKVVRNLPDNVHIFQVKNINVPNDAAEVLIPENKTRVPSYKATDTNYNEDQSGAYGILDTVRRGQNYVKDRGETLHDVTVVWYPNYTLGASYYAGNRIFHIRGQATRPGQWQPDVILHEYGHYVLDIYSKDDSPGGSHTGGQEDPRLAYSEGWGHFLQAAIQNDPRYEGLATFNIEIDTEGWGKQNEIDVAGILWDIYDPANDDPLNLGINNIWHIVTGNKPTTMQDFVNAWFYDPNRPKGQKSLGYEDELLRICRAHRSSGRPGIFNVRIVTPGPGGKVNAGPHDDPQKFTAVVEARWDNDTLLTDITGFWVRVTDPKGESGGTVTPAFNLRSQQYELDVRQPPKQPSDGVYDLIITATHNENLVERTFRGNNPIDKVVTIPVSTSYDREDGVNYSSAGGIELVLVIDSSGSMQDNDPDDTRKTAAKMLIDMAEAGDRIAVVDFDDEVRTWAPLTEITGKPGEQTPDRIALKAAVDRVDSWGWTDIEQGLQRGFDELNASTTKLQKAGILLSDGFQTVGKYTGNAASAFASKGWPVFTIALTGDADEVLLRGIASQTGGQYYKAPTAQQLAEIFTRLRGAPKGETTILTQRGVVKPGETADTAVQIDGTLKSATFSTTWSGSTLKLTLMRPNGSIVDPSDPGVTHGSGTTFEFYTIENPDAGTWTMKVAAIDVPSQGEPFVNTVSGPSPLSITLFSIDAVYLKNTPVRLSISLYEGSTPVIGATVTAVITKPATSQKATRMDIADREVALSFNRRSAKAQPGRLAETITLFDDGQHDDGAANDGIYGNVYTATDIAGDYTVDITATGQTSNGQPFTRMMTQIFRVTDAPIGGLSLEEDSHDFGSVYANAESSDAQFTINSTLASSQRVIISATDLKTANGDTIPASAVIIEPNALDVPAKSSANFRVRIHVPKGTKEGSYSGELVVESPGNQLIATLMITVITESEAPVISEITPKDGATILNPLPNMFTAKLTDVGSGVDERAIKVTIDGVAVGHQYDPETGTLTLIKLDEAPPQTSPKPSKQADADPWGPGDHIVTIEVADIAGNVSKVSFHYRVVEPPPQFAKGLDMVSIPFDLSIPPDNNPFGISDLKAAWWSPEGQAWIFFGQSGFPEFQPLTAFWVKSDFPLPIVWSGLARDQQQPASISLKPGWNMIGSPFVSAVTWSTNQVKVRKGAEEKTLEQAQQAGWIEDYAWGWEQDANNPNEGRYVLVYDTSIIPGVKGQLEPWKGYWVYAHTDCELILPPPSQGKGRGTRGEGRVARGNGWSIRLQALVNGSVGEAVIGIANRTRGLAIGLPPEPPTGNNGVQVILLKNNTPLAVDVRSDGSVRQEWDVLVRFGTRDGGRVTSERKEVTLTFDGIGYAPKDVSAWLVDAVTGKRLYLRTQTSYRFVASEGETERRFKVVVERGNERPLRVIGLRAMPVRGQGVMIEFSLTKHARVEAEVLTLTGRRVAVLDAGSNEGLTRRMVWRGVGAEGQKVGVGVYLVRVRAVDEEGRAVQAATVVRLR